MLEDRRGNVYLKFKFTDGKSYILPYTDLIHCYDSDVIMAAGAFVQGSSIELSADGPVKDPYAVYFQGGLTFPHAKFGILKAMQSLKKAGVISLPRLRSG